VPVTSPAPWAGCDKTVRYPDQLARRLGASQSRRTFAAWTLGALTAANEEEEQRERQRDDPTASNLHAPMQREDLRR